MVVTSRNELSKDIGLIIICVKNNSLYNIKLLLDEVINENTIILPLLNGLFAYDFLRSAYQKNPIINGFALGPNTLYRDNGFHYEEAGSIHIGTNILSQKIYAEEVYRELIVCGINCTLHEDISHEIWKKLMLNVAGNTITALTNIDYHLFRECEEVIILCKKVMQEFQLVANAEDIFISDEDINDVIGYFINYDKVKHTSMFDDVMKKKKTENEYIAGSIIKLAKKYDLYIPRIEVLYQLIKIKEYVYSNS